MTETTTEPDLLVGLITKDSKREVRISVRTYEGHRLVDIRLWSRTNPDAPWRPTDKGFTVKRGSQASQLATAIRKASEQAA